MGIGEILLSLLKAWPTGLPPFPCLVEVGLKRLSGELLEGKGGKRSVSDLLRQKEIAGMTGPYTSSM